MNIAQFTFNPFQENTYVVWDESGECVVIDAGNYTQKEGSVLFGFIKDKGLKPVYALNTHGHVDHILGVVEVTKEYGIPFALNGEDSFLVDTAPSHGALYGFDVKEVPVVGKDLNGLGEISFGSTTLTIIHTPGHTPGHVCFYDPASRVMFTGDTLFKASIGRTYLPGCDYGRISKRIIDRILPQCGQVTISTGPGPTSTTGIATNCNPFLL